MLVLAVRTSSAIYAVDDRMVCRLRGGEVRSPLKGELAQLRSIRCRSDSCRNPNNNQRSTMTTDAYKDIETLEADLGETTYKRRWIPAREP